MPNWCENKVRATFTDKAQYQIFCAHLELAEENNLFDLFYPTPSRQENVETILADDWYEWRIENWGTKWNPTIQDFNTSEDDSKYIYEVNLYIDTAWAPPIEFFKTIASIQFPNALFALAYYEPGMGFAGRAIIRDTECSDFYMNEIPSQMLADSGAVLHEKGYVDWDKTDEYDIWPILDDHSKFMKYYDTISEGRNVGVSG